MSAPKPPRIVAELGRPETPEETAARKAESSRAYRSSQTFRNLIVALAVTLGMVAIVVLAVPRGEPLPAPRPDVAQIATEAETALGRPVLVPEFPDGWEPRSAELSGSRPVVWDVTLAPTAKDARGFVRVALAIDADATWATGMLNGARPEGTSTIDGQEWDTFSLAKPDESKNITRAIGRPVGDDYVLIYGAISEDIAQELAESLSPQLDSIGGAS